jgi:hypothetical protein
MSNIQQVYSKSLLTETLKKEKYTKPIPIPIPISNRVGINEVNEIDGIKHNMEKKTKSFEDLRKIVSSDNNLPPSNFKPNTPPEHNMIYNYMYENDNIFMNNYNQYNISDNLMKSL